MGGGSYGNYVVNVAAQAENRSSATNGLGCEVFEQTGPSTADLSNDSAVVGVNETESIPITTSGYSNEFYVYCDTSPSQPAFFYVSMTAVQVDTLN